MVVTMSLFSKSSAFKLFSVHAILVPRGRAPFGQHQESRPLAPQRSNECACLSRARVRGNGLHHFHRNKQRQNGGRFKFRRMCFISRG